MQLQCICIANGKQILCKHHSLQSEREINTNKSTQKHIVNVHPSIRISKNVLFETIDYQIICANALQD